MSTEAFIGRGVELVAFSPDHFSPRVLAETDRMKTVLAAFEPGQFIPVHSPAADLVLAVLDGVGEVVAGEERCDVKAGDLAVIPAGQKRGVLARTRMIVLHVVSPPPSASDHAEVHAGLARGEFTGMKPPEVRPDPVAMMRSEHAELAPHLAHLEAAAAEARVAEPGALTALMGGLVGFLKDHLAAHAEEEERFLYPVVERLLRAIGGATKTMSRDHVSIVGKIADLEALAASMRENGVTDDDRAEAARILYGLSALLEVHFAKEEEIYLPLLEAGLSDAEASGLSAELSHAHPVGS